MYYIKKVFYSIKTRLGYVFRLCFPHEFEKCLVKQENILQNSSAQA